MRRFNGKKFALTDWKKKKSDAKKEADRLRKKGFLVRVAQVKGNWGIYTHNP